VRPALKNAGCLRDKYRAEDAGTFNAVLSDMRPLTESLTQQFKPTATPHSVPHSDTIAPHNSREAKQTATTL
jgi:hypothetical protein